MRPANRHSTASIAAAVNGARKASIAGAVRQAHEDARDYAPAVGLTLGGVISISDVQGNGFYGPAPGFIEPQFASTTLTVTYAASGSS